MITQQQQDSSTNNMMKTTPTKVINSSNHRLNSNHSQHQHSQQQYRCFVCFKLVKNLKGNKLSHFYDMNALDSTTNSTSPFITNGDHFLKTENNNNLTNSDCNLVINNNKKSGELYKLNKSTIGENVLKTLRDLKSTNRLSKSSTRIEVLLNDNLVYMKKICENCYRQINTIDYHLSNANKLCDLMAFKLTKSHRMIKSFERRKQLKRLNGLNLLLNNTNNNNSVSSHLLAKTSIKRKPNETIDTIIKQSKLNDLTSGSFKTNGMNSSHQTTTTTNNNSKFKNNSTNKSSLTSISTKPIISTTFKANLKLNNITREEPLILINNNHITSEHELASSSRRKRKSIVNLNF